MTNYLTAIQEYRAKEIDTLQKLDFEQIAAAMQIIEQAWREEKNIYVFGNGGSAATASHMANDFNKGISEGLSKKFRMHCLCDNFPTVMAIANDIGYDEVFRFQLQGRLRQGDLVIGISGSGNSPNVVNALLYAKEQGAKTIGITGYDGGKVRAIADYNMHVPVDDMQIAEDIHMFFDHMMMAVFCRHLKTCSASL